MKLSDLFPRFATAPKTLPQATETITEAKTTLDSVAALFTAAGLPLDEMLASGPDALKAHIESLDNSTELAEALQENERIGAELTSALTTINQHAASIEAFAGLFSAIGIADVNASTSPSEAKAKFEAHVSKQTTLALAKTGHPPAHVPAVDTTSNAKPTGAELHAQWKAMKVGPERLAFFSKHEAEITAFERNGR